MKEIWNKISFYKFEKKKRKNHHYWFIPYKISIITLNSAISIGFFKKANAPAYKANSLSLNSVNAVFIITFKLSGNFFCFYIYVIMSVASMPSMTGIFTSIKTIENF